MEIYKPSTVKELESFYGDLLTKSNEFSSIHDHLSALSDRMYEGVQSQHETILTEVSNYHWDHLGKSPSALIKLGLTEDDCRRTIANEYGFRRWTEVAHLNFPYDKNFEWCVNALLDGDMELVQKFVSENTAIVNQKSDYGHKATLLHYAVCNGVELWRQKVPLNLPEIVDFLVSKGANTQAKMRVYGGEYTASELLLSSAHPKEAGIAGKLRKILEQ